MSLADSSERTAPSGKARGPRKHPKPFRRIPAPAHIMDASRTAYNGALTTLFPWSVAEYPGILKGAWAMLLGRARPYTIRDWRRGKRKAPAWAIELLSVALKQRRDEIDHALALLSKEKGRE